MCVICLCVIGYKIAGGDQDRGLFTSSLYPLGHLQDPAAAHQCFGGQNELKHRCIKPPTKWPSNFSSSTISDCALYSTVAKAGSW